MKRHHLFTALLLALTAAASAQQTPEYVSFIRQNQAATGIVWDLPVVALTGEAMSPLDIEEGGSLFQLWAIRTTPAADFLLDQKLVGAYLPGATATITTEDPHQGVPRTRADRPFRLDITVSGLLQGQDLPDAATRVLVNHHTAAYPAGNPTLTLDQALQHDPLDSTYIARNGDHRFDFPLTSIEGSDPTLVSGEEHFIVHALPDTPIAQTQIASAMVRIWPVATGRIGGIRNAERVGTKAPALTITTESLYPRSDTYLQIYPGAPALGTIGTKLPGSVLVLDQDKPDDRTIVVAEWSSLLQADGLHTIELLTETPFGIDRLDYLTINIDLVLQVRGTLTTIE